MKRILNSFVNWYYKKEYQEYLSKIQKLEINDAIYALEEIKKKINPKTDLIKKLEAELQLRIKPFKKGINYKEVKIDKRIHEYQKIAKL